LLLNSLALCFCTGAIQRKIKRYTNRLRDRVEGATTPEAKRQKLESDLLQREADYAARQNHTCTGCGNKKMIGLYGGGNGSCHYVLPSGKEGEDSTLTSRGSAAQFLTGALTSSRLAHDSVSGNVL
jgi:hypothetical protein